MFCKRVPCAFLAISQASHPCKKLSFILVWKHFFWSSLPFSATIFLVSSRLPDLPFLSYLLMLIFFQLAANHCWSLFCTHLLTFWISWKMFKFVFNLFARLIRLSLDCLKINFELKNRYFPSIFRFFHARVNKHGNLFPTTDHHPSHILLFFRIICSSTSLAFYTDTLINCCFDKEKNFIGIYCIDFFQTKKVSPTIQTLDFKTEHWYPWS